MTIKKELIILLKNKDFFEIYTEWVSFKEIEYRVQSIKMQSTKKSNIFYEGCRENNFALFDSYLAALAKSYRFYYNKIKPEAFRELILEEITEYNKIFEIAENKNIQ